ncbi:Uncharacterized protein TCM_024671 [Theobroma cacao]|uniref:Uncharacterized protein n=1 Tax=Theobroma cacao TaxID=3641 RepID=A0A061EXX9_THECC|nr:Uncharacterized protein TCM_024671 [Theobroma cacao]
METDSIGDPSSDFDEGVMAAHTRVNVNRFRSRVEKDPANNHNEEKIEIDFHIKRNRLGLSYCHILMHGDIKMQSEDAESNEDGDMSEDYDSEDDVMANKANGPYIRLTKEDKRRIRQPWKNTLIIVEYEGLRMVYFQCGKFGHNDESCQVKQKEQKGYTEEEATNITQQNVIRENDYDSARYRPWMVAKRYTRRNIVNRIEGKTEVQTKQKSKKGVQVQAYGFVRKEKVATQDNKKFKVSLQKTNKISNEDARQTRNIKRRHVDNPIKIATSESTQYKKQTIVSRLSSKDASNERQRTEPSKGCANNIVALNEQEALPNYPMSNGGHLNMLGVGFNGDARENKKIESDLCLEIPILRQRI